ncbi:glycoside hydrolase family protein [Enterobacter asburiae]|uniref:glycoside hydrolase family protein n=1 Tax=Enterobacter asburiae TaxID=61645 RepID=UPI00387DD62E
MDVRIGHTANVVPTRDITEREAAVNLVADVLNVEPASGGVCAGRDAARVYDALVSFTFNVGAGAACRSTCVLYQT